MARESDPDGSATPTATVPSFELPASDLLPATSSRAAVRWRAFVQRITEGQTQLRERNTDPAADRLYLEQSFYAPTIAKLREKYDVSIEEGVIAGVPVEVIMPSGGVPQENRNRLLINLHGGAFMVGGRYGGQVESIPLAVTARTKVISIDYRMAPEHRFPAATEDVVAVYRALLKDSPHLSIGLYGCSAGAVLTAQTVVWCVHYGLPVPKVVGMFCGAACYWATGDSGHFAAAFTRTTYPSVPAHPYFLGVEPDNPLAFPAHTDRLMRRFPPSLLLAATRDVALSSVVYTHNRLRALAVPADLFVWDGLGHGFFYDPDAPESHDMYRIVAEFFDKHLREG